MKRKRGQIQTENMLIVGMVIFASLILLYFMTQQISETHKVSKVEDALRLLSDKVDALMPLSTGSKDTVVIDLPKGVLFTLIKNHQIIISFSKGNQALNFSKRVSTPLVGEIQNREGMQEVLLHKVNDTLVLVGKSPVLFTLQPSCFYKFVNPEGVSVKMSGVGFKSESVVLKDGEVFGGNVQIIDDKTITFWAGPGLFPQQGVFVMGVSNPSGTISNTLPFEVKTGELPCAG